MGHLQYDGVVNKDFDEVAIEDGVICLNVLERACRL